MYYRDTDEAVAALRQYLQSLASHSDDVMGSRQMRDMLGLAMDLNDTIAEMRRSEDKTAHPGAHMIYR